MGSRSGIGNFFLLAGVGSAVVGAIVWVGGGRGGSIVGMTFTMIGVIWALVALGLRGLYGRMAQRAKAEQQLFETGTRAMAVVESVETTGMVMNNVNRQIVLTLRVRPPGGAEFIHERRLFVPFHGIPRPGDEIEVAYDPSDQSTVALATDWRSDTAGGRLLVLRRAEAAAAAPRSEASGDERTAPERVIEQLERLSRLRDEGALTESEFAVQKAKVLSGQDV